MNKISISGISPAESAHSNLNSFISFAKNDLTLWADIPGFTWRDSTWKTTHKNIRLIKLMVRIAPRTPPTPEQLLHESFIDVAKALLRYRHTLKPHKSIRTEVAALRAIEFALCRDAPALDITKFRQRHWEIAVKALEPLVRRQDICRVMLDILKTLHELFILSVDPYFWKHPYVGQRSYDMLSGVRAPAEVKARKLPNQDALLAIAEVFGRSGSEQDE
ncbi:hypothetical protein PstZobell_00687, partial [Stutzerimonas stutzeri ATCC 14405 = CCUG 16156]